jgi:hypothetical protein
MLNLPKHLTLKKIKQKPPEEIPAVSIYNKEN